MPVDSCSVSPACLCGWHIRSARAGRPGSWTFSFMWTLSERGKSSQEKPLLLYALEVQTVPSKVYSKQHSKICKGTYNCKVPEHIPCHPQQGLAAQLRVSFASAAALDTHKLTSMWRAQRRRKWMTVDVWNMANKRKAERIWFSLERRRLRRCVQTLLQRRKWVFPSLWTQWTTSET